MYKTIITMKKNLLWMLVAILFSGFPMLTACGSDDDEPTTSGTDDLAFLQERIAASGSLVYGVQLGTDSKDVLNRPVADSAEAQAEFYKLLSGGAAHPGLSTADDGTMTCRLTDANGKAQGTVTYHPTNGETVYYCAEVTFSTEIKSATGISRIRYIFYDRWPEEGNGFVKGILDSIKK